MDRYPVQWNFAWRWYGDTMSYCSQGNELVFSRNIALVSLIYQYRCEYMICSRSNLDPNPHFYHKYCIKLKWNGVDWCSPPLICQMLFFFILNPKVFTVRPYTHVYKVHNVPEYAMTFGAPRDTKAQYCVRENRGVLPIIDANYNTFVFVSGIDENNFRALTHE